MATKCGAPSFSSESLISKRTTSRSHGNRHTSNSKRNNCTKKITLSSERLLVLQHSARQKSSPLGSLSMRDTVTGPGHIRANQQPFPELGASFTSRSLWRCEAELGLTPLQPHHSYSRRCHSLSQKRVVNLVRPVLLFCW